MEVPKLCKAGGMCKMGKCPQMPAARKCCFCVPIRKGVTIFGYVNLVSNITILYNSYPMLEMK